MRKNNILVITASPRPGSNSVLAAKTLTSITNPKSQISNVDINKLQFKACNACDKCRDNLKCVFNDDADILIKKVEKADVVVVASPIYFTGVPGKFKDFIDRNQVQWYKKTARMKKKKGIIILTEGTQKDKYFKPAESEIRAFFAVNHIKTVAVLKFKGMDEKGGILKDKKALNRIRKAANL